MMYKHIVRAVVAALAVALTLVGAVVSPSHAAASHWKIWPVESQGDNGANVEALQHLLNQHGLRAPITGHFGSTTGKLVKKFQKRHRLGVDGVVGKNTWTALTSRTLRQGSKGGDVAAAQVLLHNKQDSSLVINSDFNAHTRRAVIAFQKAVRIDADGVIGPDTWKSLLAGFERPHFGSKGCMYGPSSKKWANSDAIAALEVTNERLRGGIGLGNLSVRLGGPVKPHKSHQLGLSADIRPIRHDRNCNAGGNHWKNSSYDREGTRQLIRELHKHGHVRVIYFNDPALVREKLTKKLGGHDNHLHVEFHR